VTARVSGGTLTGHERARRAAAAPRPDTLTPADRYQELFVAVQAVRLLGDSKSFVDAAPRVEPDAVLAAYRTRCALPDFDLAAFVHEHFDVPKPAPSDYVSVPGQPLRPHIDGLWDVLTRHPHGHASQSSLLPLPHPYVVPGGRFRELYYWDSYFTMLGLAFSERKDLLHDMVSNFAYLIDTYGHVPNGTRSYYLSRSQPPLFAFMVELAHQHGSVREGDYLPQLRQEHSWWMSGSEGLAPGAAARRVVRLPGGELLNRYWDGRDTPREESWLEDVMTARDSGRDAAEVYRDLRAAAESGWDFSSRWLRAGAPETHAAPLLSSVCTTDIVPVDLNAFLYKLECRIAALTAQAGDAATAREFSERALARKLAVISLMWDADQGAFFDHDWRRGERRVGLTAACLAPLFAGLAEPAHAEVMASTVSKRLLAPGGLQTTECTSGQQWDRPNGWAALQWMAIDGFAKYGQTAMAQSIAHRWLATVAAVYEREGKLVEKYALRGAEYASSAGGGGGEYPLQDGFGWTNGVTRALLDAYSQHTAHDSLAHAAEPIHR